MDIIILEFKYCNLNISHEFKIMKFKIQSESDSDEVHESISKILKQYEKKLKSSLEETEIINIGTKMEIKKSKSIFI